MQPKQLRAYWANRNKAKKMSPLELEAERIKLQKGADDARKQGKKFYYYKGLKIHLA